MSEVYDDGVITAGRERWPLARGETLSSHDWFPFHYHQFLGSGFLADCLMNGRRGALGTALIYWCEAMRQDPAGTLPIAPVELATLGRFPSVEAFEAEGRAALDGFREVEVEDDGRIMIRLGHVKMLEEIVGRMGQLARGRKAKRDAGLLAQKRHRLKKQMRAIKLPGHLIENDQVVTALIDFFDRTDLYMTPDNLRNALRDELGWTGNVARLALREADPGDGPDV